jgi:phosphatidylserine/phosphatidylglycerophosphate/cardiolipin synthase-like enzyme
MGKIVKAGAWCNGEIAYLAWEADAPIDDCLGFMVTRVHETGPEAGQRRVLPTWIAFRDQSNPNWLDQDSSVWPIQQYQWRDLTLRRSRDTAAVRAIDFKVHYEITPVGVPGPGRPPVPPSSTAQYRDSAGAARYEGAPRALAIVGDTFVTEAIDVTHEYPRGGQIRATYTNGILSTQNLLQQLESVQGTKPAGVAAGPTTGVTPGLLATLKKHIPKENDPIRTFLTGDVLSFLLALVDRAERDGGELYLALYELHDPELVARLMKSVKGGKAHVILSTAGNTDPNPKKAPPVPKQPIVWDTENHDARVGLHQASPANVQDRLFNNADHIGHNKFTVYVQGGAAKAVLTGSTNWTETGLCTQSNNAILIEDDKLAELYLEYWKRLRNDPQPPGEDLSVVNGKKTITGLSANAGVQGEKIRQQNATPGPAVTLADGKTTLEVMFSPNTKAKTKNAASPTPLDLSRVYSLMEHAKEAILFLTFLPGIAGNQNIIGTAATLAAQRPELLVQGAISDPSALPPPSAPGAAKTYTKPDGTTARLPPQAIWWPQGEDSRIAMIRAAAVTTATGDLKPELLTAGHAIIHDKVIVIDPLDPVACTVITGSHNLGYKASYQNDENLLIIRGNQALAISYALHVLDVYDHYLMRAKLEDELRKALLSTGLPPPTRAGGFLDTTPGWQSRWFAPAPRPTSRSYFLSAQPA